MNCSYNPYIESRGDNFIVQSFDFFVEDWDLIPASEASCGIGVWGLENGVVTQ